MRKAIPDHMARRANREPKATLEKKARREKLDHLALQDLSGLLGQAHHRLECRSSHWHFSKSHESSLQKGVRTLC